ncbi:MAG: ribosomal protein type [Candidatus Saccharibacteria bacterium]|nr:ribosomal protein type [Candidatus Saccharibacteria bacterium]
MYTCSLTMKKDIHPSTYRPVVFQDLNNGERFITRSTVATEETIKWEDGKEYPLVKVHISSSSHPFFTGQEKLVDVEGRVDRFKARREAADAARAKGGNKATKTKRRLEAKSAKEAQDIVVPAGEITKPTA